MAVHLYFGLPGSGKTTMLAKKAYDNAFARKPKYKHIYGNIDLVGIPHYVKISSDMLGKYMLEDCLILIDEGTIAFDNRDYKNFTKNLVEFFMTHRHYNADIYIFAQSFGAVDLKIRRISDKCFYIFKTPFTGWYKSKVWRIPYGIVIPSKKDTGSDKYGEIVEGYYKPDLLTRLLTPNLKRAKYYPYFNSWDKKDLPPLPSEILLAQRKANLQNKELFTKKLAELKPYQIFKRKKYQNILKNIEKSLDK